MKEKIPKVDSEPLYIKVRKHLLSMMENGFFSETNKLPSEENLAKALGVSRSVLRDVLAIFEAEGYISRRRGIGTLLHREIVNAKTRLDIEKEFLDLISDCGYQAAIAWVRVSEVEAPAAIARRLSLIPGATLLAVTRLVVADGIPAIYCTDYLGKNGIKKNPYDEKELHKPIFYFLEKYCLEQVSHNLTEIEPICADETIAKVLKIKEGTPIFYMSEVGYNADSRPVLLSEEYHNPAILKYNILRKKF